MIFKWFATAEAQRFGKELALFILSELRDSLDKRDAKFAVRAGRTLDRAAIRLRDFKSREAINIYKKAKMANAFLWTLKDAGCPNDYANELTDWLSVRL